MSTKVPVPNSNGMTEILLSNPEPIRYKCANDPIYIYSDIRAVKYNDGTLLQECNKPNDNAGGYLSKPQVLPDGSTNSSLKCKTLTSNFFRDVKNILPDPRAKLYSFATKCSIKPFNNLPPMKPTMLQPVKAAGPNPVRRYKYCSNPTYLLNNKTDMCYPNPKNNNNVVCTTDYLYNPTTKLCEARPTCPTNYKFNSTTNLCDYA